MKLKNILNKVFTGIKNMNKEQYISQLQFNGNRQLEIQVANLPRSVLYVCLIEVKRVRKEIY